MSRFLPFLYVFIMVLTLFFVMWTMPKVYGAPDTKPQKSKFYDFSEQVIDGEIKKPTALYTEGRKKVEFDRLLNLKKSFLSNLMESSKDKVFK